jgi:hypothetical protein
MLCNSPLGFLFAWIKPRAIDWLAKYCSWEKFEAIVILLYAVRFLAKDLSYCNNLIWFGVLEPNAPGEKDFKLGWSDLTKLEICKQVFFKNR